MTGNLYVPFKKNLEMSQNSLETTCSVRARAL